MKPAVIVRVVANLLLIDCLIVHELTKGRRGGC